MAIWQAALFMSLKEKLTKQMEEKNLMVEEEKEEMIMSEELKIKTNEECTELQPVEELQIVPTLAVTVDEARNRIQMLREFVAEMMVEGQDYGKIPGCPKPTLLKPGAEKLCDIFGFSKEIIVMNRLEDWQTGLFHYEIKVRLTSKRTGHLEAEGIGSCNSKEKKYAKQDPFTMTNTILKMAKKRALVDGVLSATRSSNIFTQDMEDLKDMEAPTHALPETTFQDPITKPQIMKIKMLGKDLNFSKEDAISLLEKEYGVTCTTELTKKQATQLIKKLLSLKEAS